MKGEYISEWRELTGIWKELVL